MKCELHLKAECIAADTVPRRHTLRFDGNFNRWRDREWREGGGSLTGDVTTDAQGVARVGSWTLGPARVINGTTVYQATNRLVVESPGLTSVEVVALVR